MDIVDRIMAYESGDMSGEDALVFFQELVDTGMAWQLQGSYGRTAKRLLDDGLIFLAGEGSRNGESPGGKQKPPQTKSSVETSTICTVDRQET